MIIKIATFIDHLHVLDAKYQIITLCLIPAMGPEAVTIIFDKLRVRKIKRIIEHHIVVKQDWE